MSSDISKNVIWPGWETVRLIGRGSFGAVYEIQRDVAGETEKAALKYISIPKDKSEINMLRQQNYDDESITAYFTDYKGMFEREYSMMMRMKGHANVVYCEDIRTVQQDDGFGWDIYIKMELLEPLTERIKDGMTEEQIIKLGRDMCSALMYCEKMNVIHRDIKPENIFITREGSYKLGDFGIARTMEGTRTGTVTGTPSFMAPEVANNRRYNSTADIYSLGLTLYWLLNGQTGPFLTTGKKPTPSEKQAAQDKRLRGYSLPEPKYGSSKLNKVVLKACEYDPKERYQTAKEMLDELKKLIAPKHAAPAQPVRGRTESNRTTYRSEKSVREKTATKHSQSGEPKAQRKSFSLKKVWFLIPCVLLLAVMLLWRGGSGSSNNLSEIHDWIRLNPQVNVTYNLNLPDGTHVDSAVTELDLSGISSANFSQYESCLAYFPNLQKVNLGSAEGAIDCLSPEQIKYLMDKFPAVSFDYRIELLGRQVSLNDESIDLSGLTADMAEQARLTLLLMKNLKSVNLGDQNSTKLSWAEIKSLMDARPEAQFSYSFQLYGKSFDLTSEIIDLSYIPVPDEGEAVRAALRCMKNCKTLDMDSCGLSNEKMTEIRKEFPQVDVIWRIWFGQLYSVRTDADRVLASKPTVGGVLDDNEVAKLQYCTKIKYLDLSHNDAITNISFVSHMPELEVFIIAMNRIYDLSPLGNCPKLEYMEVSSTYISDLSPLANSKALRHLNISCCYYLTDISPLFGLTELERLWIGNQTPIPVEQVQQMQTAAPNCKISTISDDPHGDSWRYTNYDVNYHIWTWTPRYELLRAQLGYDYQEYSFYWLDPKCYLPAPPEYADIYYIHES